MVSPSAELFRRFTRSVFAAQSALLRHGDAANAPFGQTSARWRILLYVSTGQTSVAAIARSAGYSRQAVQRLASALIAEQYLTTTPDSSDGRKQRLDLTTLGSRTLEQMEEHFDIWSERLVTNLPAEDLAALARGLERVTEVVLDDCNRFESEEARHS
jgi:DNA-binding MarR family transcriptional regulator